MLSVSNISKSYQEGVLYRKIIDRVTFQLSAGELLILSGRSGSGKSTLLNLLAGLDSPDEGEIILDQQNITTLNLDELSAVRLNKIGIVFQFFNLLPNLTIYQNVSLPLDLAKARKREKEKRVRECLERLGILHLKNKLPHSVSGGEMQRAAIARAVVHRPKLLLADEPTGNLDKQNGESIVSLFRELVSEGDLSAIIVTHDKELFSGVGTTMKIENGTLSQC